MDPDQAEVADLAAVHRRVVSHRDAAAEDQTDAWVGVEHGAVLDIGLFAHDELVGVAAQHRVEPNAALVFQDDRADHVGRRRHVHFPLDLHAALSELVDHQSALPLNRTGE